MNGGQSGHSSFTDDLINAMVSNVRIQDNGQMSMNLSNMMRAQQQQSQQLQQTQQPPNKRMRIGLINGNNNDNNGHSMNGHGNNRNNGHNGNILSMTNANNPLPIIHNSGNNLPIFTSPSQADIAAPALSLLSEALKKMPALQPVSKSNPNQR